MPIGTGTNDPDGDKPEREPSKPLTKTQRLLRQWYYTALRLRDDGRNEEALDYFKRIYEIDYNYEDVAMIVEDAYRG